EETVTASVCTRPVQLSGMPAVPEVCGCEIVMNASRTCQPRAQEAVMSMVTDRPSGASAAVSATSTEALGLGIASTCGAASVTDKAAIRVARTLTDARS